MSFTNTNSNFTRKKNTQTEVYQLSLLAVCLIRMITCVKNDVCSKEDSGNSNYAYAASQIIRRMNAVLPLESTPYSEFGETDKLIEMFAAPDTFLTSFNKHITRITLPYFMNYQHTIETILTYYFLSFDVNTATYMFPYIPNIVFRERSLNTDPKQTIPNTEYLLLTITRGEIGSLLPRIILSESVDLNINNKTYKYKLVGTILGSGGHFVFVDYQKGFNDPQIFDDSRVMNFDENSNAYFYKHREQFVSQILFTKIDTTPGGRRKKRFRNSRHKRRKL
jgi:hypothetical protein